MRPAYRGPSFSSEILPLDIDPMADSSSRPYPVGNLALAWSRSRGTKEQWDAQPNLSTSSFLTKLKWSMSGAKYLPFSAIRANIRCF